MRMSHSVFLWVKSTNLVLRIKRTKHLVVLQNSLLSYIHDHLITFVKLHGAL